MVGDHPQQLFEDLGVLFSFALKRRYCLSNPCAELEKANVTIQKPGILSVDEARALLAAASDDFVPAIAIGLFAGLRPEAELWNLDWRAVDLKERLIDISVSKNSASHRFVKISDNLARWLQPHAVPSGPVSPQGDAYHSRLQKARATAAQKVAEVGIAADSLTNWPQDAGVIPSPRCITPTSSMLPKLPSRWVMRAVYGSFFAITTTG
jgi:integrase